MVASIVSAGLMWLAVAHAAAPNGDCDIRGPAPDDSAWFATVNRELPRAYFLKSQAEDSQCPSADDICKKRSYLVAGDDVLAWGRTGGMICAMFLSKKGSVTAGWFLNAALDLHGFGNVPTARDWTGHWVRDDEASLDIRRLDDGRLEIEGQATWGGNDPVRVENGGVNTGEIELTRVRLTGYAIHFIAGKGNSPPATEGEYECIVDLQWQDGALQVEDNSNCGGMNVTFSGSYDRVDPAGAAVEN